MDTLLKPGDMIRIRDDIEEGIEYSMINNPDVEDVYTDEMVEPGGLIEIYEITKDGKYHITSEIDYDYVFSYTDRMFDIETLSYYLLGE